VFFVDNFDNMPKRIIIIEDDANILYSLQAKFSVLGYKAETDDGSSEESSLSKIIDLKPDFIILDLILPKVDGFSLLKEIKTNPAVASIPVIVFTNLSDADSRARGFDLGADYYLIKSEASLDDFVSKVIKMVANRTKLV